MLSSSLMDILKVLNPSEMKGLQEYIHSPFFNKNKNVQKLFNYIYKCYPDFDPIKMKKETAYKKLFGEKRYNDGFMRTLIFILTNLSEDYLAYINIFNDRYIPKIRLLIELKNRNLKKLAHKNIKTSEKLFSEAMIHDENYFRRISQLESIKNDIFVLDQRTLDKKEVSEDLIHLIHKHRIIEFLIYSLGSFVYILNRKHLVDIEDKLDFMDEVLLHMKNNLDKYRDIPQVMFLYYELLLNIEPFNEDYYKELKSIVLTNYDKLNFIEAYNSVVGLQNFCMRMHSRGHTEYMNELFSLMEFTLKNGFYTSIKGGDFVPQHFKNYVIVGTNLKKFEWTENFIKVYVKKLSPQNRENAYNFSMAKVLFGKKDFEKALWFISRVSYQDLYYKLEVRNNTLLIYYELEMFSEAFDLMESYKKFIQNNKVINPALRNRHLFFIKIINDLLKIKISGNTKKIRQVEKEIKNSENNLNTSWLLIKLEELTLQLERN